MAMYKLLGVVFLLTFYVSACDNSDTAVLKSVSSPRTELVIYSGITMIQPLNILVQAFEKSHPDVHFTIYQGASGYLFKSILKEKSGDIYFPGSDSYRKNNLHLKLFKDYVLVGYNRVAIIVAKGNPKNLSNDLLQLMQEDLSVVLSAPNSGSIGRATKKLLDSQGITEKVYINATYFTTDSHRLFDAIKKGDADLTLNWFATAKWPESRLYLDVIELDPELAKPKRLELNLLSYSKHPELVREFMAYCHSEAGLKVFYDYGFFTKKELDLILSGVENAYD